MAPLPEWLELLRKHDVDATGIDTNEEAVAACRSHGLDARHGDGIELLRSGSADRFLAVTCFHVIEHLPADVQIDLLRAAFHALKPGGLLIFTVEEAVEGPPENGYRINPHGRYSHTRPYVETALARAGFTPPTMEGAVLRMEGGNPVAGVVVTTRK